MGFPPPPPLASGLFARLQFSLDLRTVEYGVMERENLENICTYALVGFSV